MNWFLGKTSQSSCGLLVTVVIITGCILLRLVSLILSDNYMDPDQSAPLKRLIRVNLNQLDTIESFGPYAVLKPHPLYAG